MKKIIFLLLFTFCSTLGFAEKGGPCYVDYAGIITYTTANGDRPKRVKNLTDLITNLPAAQAYDLLLGVLKKVDVILDIGDKLKTDNILRHVHLTFIYRFVHNGKPTSSWKVQQDIAVSRDGQGVNYFDPREVPAVKKLRIEAVKKMLNEELSRQCEEMGHKEDN